MGCKHAFWLSFKRAIWLSFDAFSCHIHFLGMRDLDHQWRDAAIPLWTLSVESLIAMLHFTLIWKGILWALFNLRIPLILIFLLPPLRFLLPFISLHLPRGFLSKNRILMAVVTGLVSSLYYRLSHIQRLVPSASSLIYAVISFTELNRLRFHTVFAHCELLP